MHSHPTAIPMPTPTDWQRHQLDAQPAARNKRARNPNQEANEAQGNGTQDDQTLQTTPQPANEETKTDAISTAKPVPAAFGNNPFDKLNLKPREENN